MKARRNLIQTCLLGTVLLALPVAVQASDHLYTINNGSVTITRYLGADTVLAITNTIAGLPVTGIGDNAFQGYGGLTNVTISTNLISMGSDAFYQCTSLTSVTVPDSVTSLGREAFHFCTSLATVTVGNGVTSIGYEAFASCISLTGVTLGTNVSSIGDDAFSSCTSLASLTISNRVSSIGDYAFGSCTSLTNVILGTNVASIGNHVFAYCPSLTSIMVDALNSSYRSLDGVLFDKSQATLIEYPGGRAGSYTVPNSVTRIADFAFEYCNNLTSVTIGNSLSSIGDGAFLYCASLTNATIGSGVTAIGVEAFGGCSSLASVSFGNSLTSIGDGAFDSCASLTSVTIPITNIGDGAFADCSSLTEVYFSGNAPGLGSPVFSGDNNATVYYLPGETGWSSPFGGRPAVLWNPQAQTSDSGFGVRTNQFGFNITGSSGLVIVVETCTNLGNSIWSPVGTNILTGGSSYFSDPQWTNDPSRFYRLRSP